MAFKQYTECVTPPDFHSRARFITIVALLVGTPAALVAAALNHPICLIIALEITALAGLVAYYHNWLYSRLICLGGDKDCIGMIVSIGTPGTISWNFLDRDTDYTINLLLENAHFGPETATQFELQSEAELSQPYGGLIAPQAEITAIGLSTPGHPVATDKISKMKAAVLHAEFEGDGVYNMLVASKVLLGLAIAALIACMLTPWPINLIIALGFLLLALLALLAASLFGNLGEGSPNDTNSGELTANTGFNDNGQAVGADIVYVQGTWIFDPLHEGWNEIHPIKICTKIGKWGGEWSATPGVILKLRHGFQVAKSADTLANQLLPEHLWQLHPEIDGCASRVVL
jgi:hypothetical protein